ncbi:MAG: polysaccharide deacetylase family protein [Anaerolineae bacterium]|nr:polysaccharide deacetylase family protein [Anaerolineae bacterium]
MTSTQTVPVVMYHSVLDAHSPAPELLHHLSFPGPIFRAQLDAINSMGYRTITLDDLWAWKQGQTQIPEKAVVLTFDDGYRNNWTLVHPELEKRDMCATLFVNPTFVRPAGDDEAASHAGYLSWDELRAMAESGVWRIESHTMTHDFRFTAPEIVDFHRPGTDYYWLYWLDRPDRKSHWMSDNWQAHVPYGRPVYRFGRALSGQVYHEDPAVRAGLEAHVVAHGGVNFFAQPGWREALLSLGRDLLAQHPGRMETEEEARARTLDELVASKREIEARVGQPVRHVCWPGGGYRPEWGALALEVGYRSYTLASREPGVNRQGTPPHEVKRLSFSHNLGRWGKLPGHIGYRLAVRAKLGATSESGFWAVVQRIARRFSSRGGGEV